MMTPTAVQQMTYKMVNALLIQNGVPAGQSWDGYVLVDAYVEIIEAALAARYADGAVDGLRSLKCQYNFGTRVCREIEEQLKPRVPLVWCERCAELRSAEAAQTEAHTRLLETISREGA